MRQSIRLFCFVALGLLATWQLGCNNSDPGTDAATAQADGHDGDHDGDEHDHAGHDDDHEGDHDHEMDFDASLEKVESLAATINESLANDDADAVHDSLHEIGHLLEELPEMAKEHGFSDADQEKLGAATEKMLDAYEAVDATLHGDEGKSWEEVKGDVESGLETLKSLEHSHE